MSAFDAKAELRSAIRRVIGALRGVDPNVTVRRRDLELIVALAATKTGDLSAIPPNQHPAQR